MAGGKRKTKRVVTKGQSSRGSALPPPSGKGKGEITSPPPDPDNPQKWALYGNRKVWPERGIKLSVLGSTFVPHAVQALNWFGFVRTPNVAALDLVREFYYAMVPHRFSQGLPVIVRGREVLITPTKINNWFETSQELDDYVDGVPNHEFFEPYNGDLASDLRSDGSHAWNDHRHPLLLSELKIDAAFWIMFFDYSLTPKTHRSELSFDTARHFYCARNMLEMDIGQIIVQHIHKGAKTKGPLPFPCLITHFCEEAGIEWNREGDNLITPTFDIGKKTYNELVRRRGVRPIGGNVLDDDDMAFNDEDLLEDDPDDEDYDGENVGGGPDTSTGNQNPTMAQMMQSMSLQLEANNQYLQAMSQQMNSNHQNYMGEFLNINQRLDDLQSGLVNHGVNIPIVYRRRSPRGQQQAPPNQDMPPQDPNFPYQGP